MGPFAQFVVGAPHPAIALTAGLMQLGGLVLFILGFTETNDAEVPIYAFGDPHDAQTARLSMSVAPTVGGAASTLTLTFCSERRLGVCTEWAHWYNDHVFDRGVA